MGKLDGKVALVTGAGSGIGRASALRMAAEGAAVMCADIDAAGAGETAAAIKETGANAAAEMALDVTDGAGVEAALGRTVEELGGLDILFNNAGVGGAEHGWDRTIAVNLQGVYHGLVHGAPFLAARGGGTVLNTASIAGLVGLTGPAPVDPAQVSATTGAYVASKHGVNGLTKQYAIIYARSGVRVNAIAPGYIETPMTAPVREFEEVRQGMANLHPMGRFGQPEEIAAAAVFLASDDASFITGIVLPVDGGYTAR